MLVVDADAPNFLLGIVKSSLLVAFSPSYAATESLIPRLGSGKFRPQNLRILLNLTAPAWLIGLG